MNEMLLFLLGVNDSELMEEYLTWLYYQSAPVAPPRSQLYCHIAPCLTFYTVVIRIYDASHRGENK